MIAVKNSRAGFSLIEVLIYAALTGVVVTLLGSILITTLKIQGQQSSSIDLTKDLTFLMGAIKRYIYSAHSYVVAPDGASLELALPGESKSIFWDQVNYKVILSEDSGNGTVTSDLSSQNIRIDNLVFTSLSSGSSSAIQITITATANANNPTTARSKTLRSTAALMLQEQ